jgi:phosphoglycerate dehydrogenase-like enzyme
VNEQFPEFRPLDPPTPVDFKESLVICSYIHPDLVSRIRDVDYNVEVIYEPDLLPRPRYASDHVGSRLRRGDADERVWREFLARASILFDFDRTNRDELPELAPHVRWIQFTSAGIGQLIARQRYAERWPGAVFTSAAGIHAQPLAEYAVMSMLAFSRGLLQALGQQREKSWERFAGTDLLGRTVLIYGLGGIGKSVARVSRSLGMHVVGVKRSVEGIEPQRVGVDELGGPERLRELLPRANFLVLSAPHTPETEHVIGEEELALLPQGAVVINVGRGALIDEPSLVAALQSGHLGGASLDVFEEEPLPEDSPFWEMPNVIVSPHSGSTSDRENERIIDLFCENLDRFLRGETLVNVLDTDRLY